ncbi:MAG: restriction endonuclease subunit S [Nanoarchaeota archaeon]
MVSKWKDFKIEDLGEIITGNTPSKSEPENYGDKTPWVKPPNLDIEKYLFETEDYLSEIGTKKARILPKGTVLVSCIGNIGKIAIAGRKMCTNQQINSIVPNNNISGEFLYYAIKKFQKRLEDKATKAVVQLLNKTEFSKVEIPIPILSDGTPDRKKQEEIVSILEKAEALKNKRKEAEEILDEYLKAVFYNMFLKHKEKFEEVELSEISELITKGTTPTTYGYKYQESGIPFLKVENITSGEINFSVNSRYIDEETHEFLKRSQLRRGDVLFSIAGAIGRSAVVNTDKKMNLNQAIAIIRPKKIINSRFLSTVLNTSFIKNQIQNVIVKVAQANLSLTEVRKIKIPLPPKELQEKFLSIINYAKQFQIEEETEDIFNSLSQKTFTGELVK